MGSARVSVIIPYFKRGEIFERGLEKPARQCGIREAAVAVRGEGEGQTVVAYVVLQEGEGLVEVRLDEGEFHLWLGGAGEGPVYGDGAAPGEPDARLALACW